MILRVLTIIADSAAINIWWQTSAIVAISGTIGSMATILGVYLTNTKTDAREERRLKHDSLQKELDRKFDLKQAKYLAAILQIKRLPIQVIAIVDTPVEKLTDTSPEKELVAAQAEMELIASLEVLTAWAACMAFWGRSSIDLLQQRMAIDKKALDASTHSDLSVKRIIESEIVQAKMQLRGQCLGISSELAARLTNVVVEMRNDLGFDIDRRAYEMLVIKNSKAAREAAEKSIKDTQDQFQTMNTVSNI